MAPNVGEMPLPPICAGDGCLRDAAPGNTFCWQCIRSKTRAVRDYQAKVQKHAAARIARAQAKIRPRLYALTLGPTVKFGISVDVRSRVGGLQTSLPYKLTLVGHVGCDRQLEKDVHALCSGCHIRGEWFHRIGVALQIERHIEAGDVAAIYKMIGRFPDWLKP